MAEYIERQKVIDMLINAALISDEDGEYSGYCTVVNPIIDWEDSDVWNYAQEQNICLNCLYEEGQHRVGCIGCPMAVRKNREKEFIRWPAYKKNYILAFEKMLQVREQKGKMNGNWKMGTTGIDVFNWWMEYADYLPGQIDILEEL